MFVIFAIHKDTCDLEKNSNTKNFPTLSLQTEIIQTYRIFVFSIHFSFATQLSVPYERYLARNIVTRI